MVVCRQGVIFSTTDWQRLIAGYSFMTPHPVREKLRSTAKLELFPQHNDWFVLRAPVLDSKGHAKAHQRTLRSPAAPKLANA